MLLAFDNGIDELERRIRALVPANPSILEMTNAFDLLKIEGFAYRDLQPSLGQVSAALRRVQRNPHESLGRE